MIDPMASGTAKRPSADLNRPRGREVLSAHPPTPVDDTPRGSLEQPTENTRAPVTLLSPESFSDDEASLRHFERQGEPDAGTSRHATAVRRRSMSRLRRLETALHRRPHPRDQPVGQEVMTLSTLLRSRRFAGQ